MTCRSCPVIRRSLGPGESVRCACGQTHSAPRTGRGGAARSPRLALLADCAAIARWDAAALPRSVTLASDDGNTGGGARPESTERPDWANDNHDAIARCGELRKRLNDLWRCGRQDSFALEVVYAIALVADEAIGGEAEDRPGSGPIAPTLPSAGERAAAVIEFLVPRAKVAIDSAHGQKGTPVLKSLPREVGRAFATAHQLARWNPPVPLKPARPEPPVAEALEIPEPKKPAVDTEAARAYPGRTEDARAARAYESARAEWLSAMAEPGRAERIAREYAQALTAHEAAVRRWEEATKDWDRGPEMRRWAEQVEAGRTGAERHGNELLMLAERVWFGG
jgi:hypothetical protein